MYMCLLSSYPLLPSLSPSLPQVDSRILSVNEWSKPAGQQSLHQLARLYRALVWEGFILLAVAAKEDRETRQPAKEALTETGVSIPSQSHSGTESSLEIPSGTTAQSPHSEPASDTVVSMDTSSAVVAELQNQGMETSEPASKLSGVGMGPSGILIQSLKQLTPLLTITSRVGRSLAELLSFHVKVCTSPLHRPHRRGAGFLIPHYHPPSEEAIAVCSEVTNLLLDSLKWEVPMPETCLPAMESPIRDWLFGG